MLDYESRVRFTPIAWSRRYRLLVPIFTAIHFALFLAVWAAFVILSGKRSVDLAGNPAFQLGMFVASIPGQFLSPYLGHVSLASPIFLIMGAINSILFGTLTVGIWQIFSTLIQLFGDTSPIPPTDLPAVPD